MFVFYTGLHIDKDHFLGEHASRQFWILSLTSLFMPLLLGCFAGWIFLDYMYGDYLVGKGSRATYILSLGISAGVTALPVLSAILLEVPVPPLQSLVVEFSSKQIFVKTQTPNVVSGGQD
jgi:Kef-type K+ transport system membrane component KefB